MPTATLEKTGVRQVLIVNATGQIAQATAPVTGTGLGPTRTIATGSTTPFKATDVEEIDKDLLG